MSFDNPSSKIRNRKWFELSIVIFLFLVSAVAQAQQRSKIPRIGYLSVNSPSSESARTEVFRQGLRELGYAETKNILIEWRFAEGKLELQSTLAVELVNLNVDIIVMGGTGSTRAANGAFLSS